MTLRLALVLGCLAASAQAQVLPMTMPGGTAPSGLTRSIRVTADGMARVDDAVMDSTVVSNAVREPLRRPDAVVHFGTDRGLRYELYILWLDIIKDAYTAERDSVSVRDFGIPFERLTPSARERVMDEVPLRISLAEPTGG